MNVVVFCGGTCLKAVYGYGERGKYKAMQKYRKRETVTICLVPVSQAAIQKQCTFSGILHSRNATWSIQ